MGFGIGIGMGWPNRANSGGVKTFEIKECNGTLSTVYSSYPKFLPGAYMFEDSNLTKPFGQSGIWNLSGLINTIGGYGMAGDGEVKNPLTSCKL
jgi:hypothetical protein